MPSLPPTTRTLAQRARVAADAAATEAIDWSEVAEGTHDLAEAEAATVAAREAAVKAKEAAANAWQLAMEAEAAVAASRGPTVALETVATNS